MNTYFHHLSTPEEVKNHYRRLAKQHHPDLGGDTATMQRINAEYEHKLSQLDGYTDKEGHKYRFNAERERAVMAKIHELLALRMPGVEIFLIGTWVWVQGTTRPWSTQLKALSLKWNPKRESWFFHEGTWKGRHSKDSLQSLAYKYGATEFSADKLSK